MAAKVYFTREITPEALVKIFECLNLPPSGKVGVKISTGETGNPHYLRPGLIKNWCSRLGAQF